MEKLNKSRNFDKSETSKLNWIQFAC